VKYEVVNNVIKLVTDADWDGNVVVTAKLDKTQTSTVFFKLDSADGDYWSEGAPFGVGDKGETGVSVSAVQQVSTTNADGDFGVIGYVDTYKMVMTNGDSFEWSLANGNEYTDTDAIAAVEGKDRLVAKLSADSTAVTPADDAVDEAIATKKYVLDNVAKADEAGEISVVAVGNLSSENVQDALEELQGDINTLNADDTVDGSVDTKVKALADGQVTTNKNNIVTLNAALGTGTQVRYDKVLGATDGISMTYNGDGKLEVVRHPDDGDTEAPYYRDELAYNGDGKLETVKHYYNTADLDTASGTTTLSYTDGKLTSTSYTE
jgi:hypothetical protein